MDLSFQKLKNRLKLGSEGKIKYKEVVYFTKFSL